MRVQCPYKKRPPTKGDRLVSMRDKQNLTCIQLDGASFLASLFRSSTRYSTVLLTPVLNVFHWRLGFRRVLRTDCSSCSPQRSAISEVNNIEPIRCRKYRLSEQSSCCLLARRLRHKLSSVSAVLAGHLCESIGGPPTLKQIPFPSSILKPNRTLRGKEKYLLA